MLPTLYNKTIFSSWIFYTFWELFHSELLSEEEDSCTPYLKCWFWWKHGHTCYVLMLFRISLATVDSEADRNKNKPENPSRTDPYCHRPSETHQICPLAKLLRNSLFMGQLRLEPSLSVYFSKFSSAWDHMCIDWTLFCRKTLWLISSISHSWNVFWPFQKVQSFHPLA